MENAVAPKALRANSASLGNLAAIEVVAPAARLRNNKAANVRALRLAATDRLPAHADRADRLNDSSVAARAVPVVIAVVAAHRAAIGARGMKGHRSRFSFRRRR